MSTDNKDTLMIFSEEDEPFRNDQKGSDSTKLVKLSLSEREARKAEQKAKVEQKYASPLYRKRGFWLIVGCLIGYLVLVIFDSVIPIWNLKLSDLSENFVELLKYVVSTLIGFVFSESLKNYNDDKDDK